MTYPGLFKRRYLFLVGRDWLKQIITSEDKKAFGGIGYSASDRRVLHHLGGVARARSATRDSKGRFARRVT